MLFVTNYGPCIQIDILTAVITVKGDNILYIFIHSFFQL
jgi:hypothetical protein